MSRLWAGGDLELHSGGGSYMVLLKDYPQGNIILNRDELISAALTCWQHYDPLPSIQSLACFILDHFLEEEVALIALRGL
jgi:hypothetical protein